MPATQVPPSPIVFDKVREDALALDLVRAVNKAIEHVLDGRPDVSSDLRNRAETAMKAACTPLARRAAASCGETMNQVIAKFTTTG